MATLMNWDTAFRGSSRHLFCKKCVYLYSASTVHI